MPTCIDLQKRFGNRYRIGFDPAYDPKHRPKDKLDPWMMLIPCERGEIYPHGGDLLAVGVDGRPVTARKLADSGVCTLHQDGDTEKTFLFNVADFAAVAAIVKPRRRRQLSAQQKERLIAAGAKHRFPPKPRRTDSPQRATTPAKAST